MFSESQFSVSLGGSPYFKDPVGTTPEEKALRKKLVLTQSKYKDLIDANKKKKASKDTSFNSLSLPSHSKRKSRK